MANVLTVFRRSSVQYGVTMLHCLMCYASRPHSSSPDPCLGGMPSFYWFPSHFLCFLVVVASSAEPSPCLDVAALAVDEATVSSVRSVAVSTTGLGGIKISAFSLLVNGFSQSSSSGCVRAGRRPTVAATTNSAVRLHSSNSSSSSSSDDDADHSSDERNSQKSQSAASLVETRKPKRPNLLQLPCVARPAKQTNGHITMATEDLLQPGHVVKERWKVVRFFLSPSFIFTIFLLTLGKKKANRYDGHFK